jgi:hypothetical protein
MRAPYLRQIAQPQAADMPALRSSRRWPFRPDEARLPVSEPAPFHDVSSGPARDAVSGRALAALTSPLRQTAAERASAGLPTESLQSEPRSAQSLSQPQSHPSGPPISERHPGIQPMRPEPAAPDPSLPPREVHRFAAPAPPVAAVMPPMRDAAAPPSPSSRITPAAGEAIAGRGHGTSPERSGDEPGVVVRSETAAHASSPGETAHTPGRRTGKSAADAAPAEPARTMERRTGKSATDAAPAEPTAQQPSRLLSDPDDRPAADFIRTPAQPAGRSFVAPMIRSGQAAEPSLKIGTVEVRVMPAPQLAPPLPARAANPPGALSRGFSSPFGLRQG